MEGIYAKKLGSLLSNRSIFISINAKPDGNNTELT
jgi:hypothetical protein